MYIKKSLVKKYLKKISDKILQSSKLQILIEQEKELHLERKLLGEKFCLSVEFFEDDRCCYVSLTTWQVSHWTFVFQVICPASYNIPIRKK